MARVSHQLLDFQSRRLESWLAAHRAPFHVERAVVVDGWIRFEMTPAAGTSLPALQSLRDGLAFALGADDVHLAPAGKAFAVEVPRPGSVSVMLLPLMDSLLHLPRLTACAGLAGDGRPLLIRLPSPEVGNVLIAGGEGCGKTELLRALLLSLALAHRQSQLQLALLDSRAHGLAPLAGLPHLLAPAAASPAGAEALLQRLTAEIERREAERVNSPYIVVAIDDFPELLGLSGRNTKAALAQLVQRGRAVGISLVVAARPSPGLAALPRADFPIRLVGRVETAEQAREASGIGGSGADQLAGHGSFVAVANGQPIPFKAAWIPAKDWREAVTRLSEPATVRAETQ